MTTLYQQIGGANTIDNLVNAFYDRVLQDPELAPFFSSTSMGKLRTMQKTFFSIALGGPEPNPKISLYQAHRGRGITRKHLTRFTEHLVETLRAIGIEENAAQEVYRRIATYSDEVLGETAIDG